LIIIDLVLVLVLCLEGLVLVLACLVLVLGLEGRVLVNITVPKWRGKGNRMGAKAQALVLVGDLL